MIEKEQVEKGKTDWFGYAIIVGIIVTLVSVLAGGYLSDYNKTQSIKQAVLTRNITTLASQGCTPADVTNNDIVVLCGTIYDYNITSNTMKMLGSSG
jgi:hypothetical protein